MYGREKDSVRESDAADVLDESRVGVEVACCADASGRRGGCESGQWAVGRWQT